MRQVVCGVLVGLLGWVGAGAARADTPRASMTVRTYTHVDSAGHLEVAHRTASAILADAGIDVTWLECAPPAPDTCEQPRRANELVVRIVPSAMAATTGDPGTLGFAFVDLEGGDGWLATVYADRVAAMARAAGSDTAQLLGRTIAHEIGHLLLGTNRHGSRGLMRASWSVADVRRKLPTQWEFSGKERATMRTALAHKSHIANHK